MMYRPQRGSLLESMEDAAVLAPTKEALAEYLHAKIEDVDVKLYTDFPDDRIGWERTYVVLVKGVAWGFTNGVGLEAA